MVLKIRAKVMRYLRDAVFTFKRMTGCAPDYLNNNN